MPENLSDLLVVAAKAGLLKYDNVYALSDGHILVNPDEKAIKAKCLAENITITTLKGKDIDLTPDKETKQKPEKE